MQSLYDHYDKYGKVLFSGVFNASLLLEYHTSAVKSKLLCDFVELCNFCVPMLDFSVHGEQFNFITKQTMIDYLLLEKKTCLTVWSIMRFWKKIHYLLPLITSLSV